MHRGKSGRSHTGTSTETRGDRNETLKITTFRHRLIVAPTYVGLQVGRPHYAAGAPPGPRRRVVACWLPGRIGVLTIASPTGKSGQI